MLKHKQNKWIYYYDKKLLKKISQFKIHLEKVENNLKNNNKSSQKEHTQLCKFFVNCYEEAINEINEILCYNGVPINNISSETIKKAFYFNIIIDGKLWMDIDSLEQKIKEKEEICFNESLYKIFNEFITELKNLDIFLEKESLEINA